MNPKILPVRLNDVKCPNCNKKIPLTKIRSEFLCPHCNTRIRTKNYTIAFIVAAISFGMDIALGACVLTGPAMFECMAAVLLIAEGPEALALFGCGIHAKKAYDKCLDNRFCDVSDE